MIYETVNASSNASPQNWYLKLKSMAEDEQLAKGLKFDISVDFPKYIKRLKMGVQCKCVDLRSDDSSEIGIGYGRRKKLFDGIDIIRLFIFWWESDEEQTIFMLKYA